MNAEDRVVLVVDDDEDIRESLCEILESEGYRAVCVANGKEALRALRDGPQACVILLDLMMPVMDGWTFLKEQRSDPRIAPIPVVVITAFSQRSADLASVPVLQKPLRVDTVLGTVQAHC